MIIKLKSQSLKTCLVRFVLFEYDLAWQCSCYVKGEWQTLIMCSTHSNHVLVERSGCVYSVNVRVEVDEQENRRTKH